MTPPRKKRPFGKTASVRRIPLPLAVFLKILLVVFFFFFSRILFWLFNLHYFSGLPASELARIFLTGLRFDLSSALAVNLPLLILFLLPLPVRDRTGYRKMVTILFYVVNILGFMVNFGDTVYFRFTLKRLTSDFFSYLGIGGDFHALFPQFIKDFWPVLIAWIGVSALFVWLCSRIRIETPAGNKTARSARWYVFQSTLFVLAAGLAVIGIRGGIRREAITLKTPSSSVSLKYYPLVANTVYTLVHSVNSEPVVRKEFFQSEEELAGVFTPFHPAGEDTLCPLNVCILVMESFSREHIGALNRDLENGRYQGYTPFLDSLIGESLVFSAYANGKSSIQAIPTILSGIPALMDEPLVQSDFSGNQVAGLGGLLRPYGYETAFFHGGTNGIMVYDGFLPGIGFSRYYGRTEYANDKDYDGKWGIYDEEFMQFMILKMREIQPPFAVTFFSLSSHHPYGLPGKYKHKFEKGRLPIQQVIRYADFALKEFFHTARQEEWFYNTLFVITADHTSEGYYPWYNTHAGQYSIPLIFYKPGSGLKGFRTEIAQQTDILPTVLGFLGYDKPFIAFGNNLLQEGTERFSVSYLTGSYTLIKDGFSMEFDGVTTNALFDLKQDPLQRNNLAGKGVKQQDSLEHFLKAYLQQYNNRMIENRLTAN